MKTIEYYMNLQYKMEIVADPEGGYVASFPDLPGCLSCGETVQQAIENAEDAKKAWLEAAIADEAEIREPSEQQVYSGQFKLRVPKTLHRTLAEQARREGISMNRYCVYLLSKGRI